MSTDDDIAELIPIDDKDDSPFWFDAGIYKDESFILFQIGLFEISQAYPGKQITVLHLHIGYFHLDFGWETK